MKIVLNTNDATVSERYIEALVLLYFPCEKFGKGSSDKCLDILISREKDSIYGKALLTFDGKKTEKQMKEYLPEYSGAVKCFCGKMIISLLNERTGYIPPWGIMTGVKPARFALGLMIDEGLAPPQVCEALEKRYLVSPEKAALAVEVAEFDKKVLNRYKERDYSLYIGIPFCPGRCRYCSFVSYATPQLKALLPEYTDALLKEVSMLSETARSLNLKLKSVYIGGGTPTVLEEKQLEKLLEMLNNNFELNQNVEFTCEAGRPDTINKKKLELLKKYGVGRISVNTQTTNDSILSSVGRGHTFSDYIKAYHMAEELGFSVNTDLIAGLPGESTESFRKSVDDVVSLLPGNITVHAFSLKKSSEYTCEGRRFDISDDKIADMISYSYKKITDSGYFPYYIYRQKNTEGNFENTGYTRDEFSAGLYNVYMMEGFHTVLAAGAGAATKLVSKDLSNTRKIYNPKYPYEYLRAADYIYKKKENIIRFYAEQYN